MPQTNYTTVNMNAENPLDEKTEEQKQLELTQKQLEYQSYLETRLTRAQELRDRKWAEFNNKTYLQYYEENERIANTVVDATKNDGEPQVSAGTIEGKLNTLLSHVDNLNITPEVLAFDTNDAPLHSLGIALTDILDRQAEHDGGDDGGDQEKRLLRQKDLMKQGTVFVQRKWCTKRQMKKSLKGKYNGQFNGVEFSEKLTKVFEGIETSLLYGPNVYLGDITQYSMDDQPYAFTVETIHYDKAKEYFGTFENWKYVKKGMPPSPISLAQNATGGRTLFDGKFRLTTLKDTQVEIVKYQDPTRDEFQITINGIMMLPIGFPLSAVTPGGKFNIVKQILYSINPQFAYGKSFVSSGDVYELSKIVDEMLRLFILKTRKSITPPYTNISGKVISRKSLMPGNISMGIPPNALQAIGTEGQGVTAGEYQVYKEIIDRIEKSTVSPIFQGQFGKANTTATEVIEVQRQARLALGIIISACTMMEVKLGYLGLWIIMEHFFKPIGEYVDENGVARKTYRQTSKSADIEGGGTGTRRVIPVDGQLPSAAIIREMEIMDEKETGYPSERIYLSPKKLHSINLKFRVVANPKERVSSAYEKVLFKEMLGDALSLINLGSVPNTQGLEQEFGRVYGTDVSKIFGSRAAALGQQTAMADAATVSGNRASGNMPNAGGAPTGGANYSQQMSAGIS